MLYWARLTLLDIAATAAAARILLGGLVWMDVKNEHPFIPSRQDNG